MTRKLLDISDLDLIYTSPTYSKETFYDGIIFRSKLEAKWAYIFNFLKIEYKYEPTLFRFENRVWYLPDFRLPQLDLWIEVKGKNPTRYELKKIISLSNAISEPIYIFIGTPQTGKFQSKFTDQYIFEAHGIDIWVIKKGEIYYPLGYTTVNHSLLNILNLLKYDFSINNYHLYSTYLASAINSANKRSSDLNKLAVKGYTKAIHILMKDFEKAKKIHRSIRN